MPNGRHLAGVERAHRQVLERQAADADDEGQVGQAEPGGRRTAARGGQVGSSPGRRAGRAARRPGTSPPASARAPWRATSGLLTVRYAPQATTAPTSRRSPRTASRPAGRPRPDVLQRDQGHARHAGQHPDDPLGGQPLLAQGGGQDQDDQRAGGVDQADVRRRGELRPGQEERLVDRHAEAPRPRQPPASPGGSSGRRPPLGGRSARGSGRPRRTGPAGPGRRAAPGSRTSPPPPWSSMIRTITARQPNARSLAPSDVPSTAMTGPTAFPPRPRSDRRRALPHRRTPGKRFGIRGGDPCTRAGRGLQ